MHLLLKDLVYAKWHLYRDGMLPVGFTDVTTECYDTMIDMQIRLILEAGGEKHADLHQLMHF